MDGRTMRHDNGSLEPLAQMSLKQDAFVNTNDQRNDKLALSTLLLLSFERFLS